MASRNEWARRRREAALDPPPSKALAVLAARAQTGNLKPADRLAWLRQQIKALQAEERAVRDALAASGGGRGDAYDAVTVMRRSRRLSRDKLTAALGDLDPFYGEVEALHVVLRAIDP